MFAWLDWKRVRDRRRPVFGQGRRLPVLAAVLLLASLTVSLLPFPALAAPGDGRSSVHLVGDGDDMPGPSAELRGVWISYLDWDKLPADEAGFRKGVDQILDRCLALKMNAVFVQVRPDADAVYPSEIFPWSRARIRAMILWNIL